MNSESALKKVLTTIGFEEATSSHKQCLTLLEDICDDFTQVNDMKHDCPVFTEKFCVCSEGS
jgi:hypothetical protein